MPLFSKVLVANRGEIAIRIFRTLRELEIVPVAVYSEADRDALHVRAAAEAYLVGPGPAAESYLIGARIVEAAQQAGAEAIHPGYGFLAENAPFARLVEESGLAWIGPPSAAIELMGSKTRARTAMQAAGVPIIPGATDPVESVAEVLRLGAEVGYPLIVKAAAGGGGKGMKLVAGPDEAERAFDSARREGEKYFADGRVYVERYLVDPRHVEVQVLADAHGNVIHLGERDCTIQRRHQKLIEETPSPAVDDALRERIGRIAVDAARAAGYRSAGTIEGLLTADGDYYFMEMNTRIQVEHTVTEEVTGIDLVREQVRIAAGEPLSLAQADVHLRGHAIECRINAEDVSSGFLPAPGRITAYREPAGPGVRVDSGVVAGSEITDLYDPMIAKLIVHGVDREHARLRMLRALDEFELAGPPTLLGFHRALLSHPCFVAGTTCHGVVDSPELAERADELTSEEKVARVDSLPSDGRVRPRATAVEVGGRRFDVTVLEPEPPWAELARRRRGRAAAGRGGAGGDAVVAPMQGTVLAVDVVDGDVVRAGDVVCVVEAMKMENEIVAHRDGTVSDLAVAAGDPVASGQVICRVLGERPLCAETSRAHAESLAATASRVDTWILLEYRGLWAHDAVEHSTLTDELKVFLRAERARLPHARILFVRAAERRGRDGVVAFVARTTQTGGELRRLEVERHDDLIGRDLESTGELVDHPLLLVCTHGKHDRCCAKYGRPLYDAVREQVDEGWAWQSSHVGGDRFAGNVVVLPDGVYYGRVEPGEAWSVVEAALERRVHLPRYRGRSCHGFAAQAAELAVRERTGLLGVPDVRVARIGPDGDGWRARVATPTEEFEVRVRREHGEATHLTCSTEQLRRPSRFVAGTPRGRGA